MERLKDHINMHFIGQVKKSPGGTLSTEHPEVHAARGGRDSASPGSRVNCSPSPNLSGRRRRKVRGNISPFQYLQLSKPTNEIYRATTRTSRCLLGQSQRG